MAAGKWDPDRSGDRGKLFSTLFLSFCTLLFVGGGHRRLLLRTGEAR